MTYFEDYIRNMNEGKLHAKKQKLELLENQFNESPSNELAHKIVKGYNELAQMPQGWQLQNMSFAYVKAKRYESFLD